MDAAATKPVWRFDRFTLDLSRGALLAADGAERALRPKSLAVLRHLVVNAGRLCRHDQILQAVWSGIFVTEDSVAQCVKEIQRALGDAEQDYFAGGITEELTTALSHARWFSVIACNSAFTYKGRAAGVRQVGRELGVGYVLEGSVRKAGGRVRIASQLCEAEAGRSIWAGRLDGELADIFDLQDRIAEAVAGAIEPNLQQAEIERARAKPTGSPTAYDLSLHALPQRPTMRDGNEEAIRLLRRALALDPGLIAAKGALAGQTVPVSPGAGANLATSRRRCAAPANWWRMAVSRIPPRSPGRGTRSHFSAGTMRRGAPHGPGATACAQFGGGPFPRRLEPGPCG